MYEKIEDTIITIDLPKDLEQYLEFLAQKAGKTINQFICEIISNYLDEVENNII